ncbi:30S ribosomal protein S21 [bacterium]|nr:30S ribosomal protein S21 [bacterium]
MITVKVRIGEALEKSLRALKKKIDKEGVMKAVKANRYAKKPSLKKKEKQKQAMKYNKKRRVS